MTRNYHDSLGKTDEAWEKIHSSREWGLYPAEHVIRFVARNYYKKKRSKIKILDFGIGGGAHTWFLAREGFDTYGFDGSPSAVKRTKDRLVHEKLSATLSCANGQDVKYKKNFFDAVIDNFCICSNEISDILLMYEKIHFFLKKKGRLLTATFGKKTTGFGLGTLVERDTYTDISEGPLANLGKIHFFSLNGFVSTLKKIGFENVKCDECIYTDNGNTIEMLIAQCEK